MHAKFMLLSFGSISSGGRKTHTHTHTYTLETAEKRFSDVRNCVPCAESESKRIAVDVSFWLLFRSTASKKQSLRSETIRVQTNRIRNVIECDLRCLSSENRLACAYTKNVSRPQDWWTACDSRIAIPPDTRFGPGADDLMAVGYFRPFEIALKRWAETIRRLCVEFIVLTLKMRPTRIVCLRRYGVFCLSSWWSPTRRHRIPQS